MPKYTDLILPSEGMNYSFEPQALAPLEAAQLTNLLYDQSGKLVYWGTNIPPGGISFTTIGQVFPHQIDSLGYYVGGAGIPDSLLAWSNGHLYAAPFITPTSFGTLTDYGACYTSGQKVRWRQYKTQIIFVCADGKSLPQYWCPAVPGTGDPHLAPLGMLSPSAWIAIKGSGSFAAADHGAGGNKGAGTYNYVVTFFDWFGQESSPSNVASVTVAAGHSVDVTYTPPSSPTGIYPTGTIGLNFYCQVPGSVVFEFIGSSYGPFPLVAVLLNDNLTDNQITAALQIAPNPGQFDPPTYASLIEVDTRARVWLNNTYDIATGSGPVPTPTCSILQYSVTGGPGQFTTVQNNPVLPTDGGQLVLLTDQSGISAIAKYGAFLSVWTRQHFGNVWGDDNTSFVYRGEVATGCCSADSVAQIDDILLYASDDGIYQTSYSQGFVSTKISKQIETGGMTLNGTFAPLSIIDQANRKAWEAIIAFVYLRYYIYMFGTLMYVWSKDNPGWTSVAAI